jgi:hypothetical protein
MMDLIESDDLFDDDEEYEEKCGGRGLIGSSNVSSLSVITLSRNLLV